MGASLDWINKRVENVSFDELHFRVGCGGNKYVFGAMYPVEENEIDIFAISSIYDTIMI